jgi:hypothetical protein
MNQYVILNKGEPIHVDLVGEAIVGSKAHTSRRFGYNICPICHIVVNNDKHTGKNYAHQNSARHIKNLRNQNLLD